jgi:hypothetical protein
MNKCIFSFVIFLQVKLFQVYKKCLAIFITSPSVHKYMVPQFCMLETLTVNLTNTMLKNIIKIISLKTFMWIRIQWYNFLHCTTNVLLAKIVVKVESIKTCAP